MEQMWFWFVVLKKKKASYFKIKPFDWIQTSSEACLRRKRHCIINKPSLSVLVDLKKKKINPNKSHSNLNSGSTDGKTGLGEPVRWKNSIRTCSNDTARA